LAIESVLPSNGDWLGTGDKRETKISFISCYNFTIKRVRYPDRQTYCQTGSQPQIWIRKGLYARVTWVFKIGVGSSLVWVIFVVIWKCVVSQSTVHPLFDCAVNSNAIWLTLAAAATNVS
jgi:hypothetical protein